tara:strand:- start:493 stop:699 length:207 start_codon:yes stop_codon:yes gene_type:complete
MDTFIKLVDNSGDIYYANPRNIAFLKANSTHGTGSPIYKVVITSPSNERQIIVDENQFIRIKNKFYGA